MKRAPVHLRLSWRFALAYFALVEVIWELHEQAHIQLGRVLCGGYGPRDFNVWGLAPGCGSAQPLALLAPLAGPVFSFAVCYAGLLLVCGAGAQRVRMWGVALMLAPIPFARLAEAARQRGDEIVFLRRLLGPGVGAGSVQLIAVTVLGALCVPLALAAWHALRGGPRWRWIVALSFLPLPATFAVKLVLLNEALRAGWLAAPEVLGTPALVWVYFALMGALLAWGAQAGAARAGVAPAAPPEPAA